MASLFLAVVAVLIQAPSLFYMGTALFALIGGSNLQAWLAVRGLRFDRLPVGSARVGDLVTVEVQVWSDYRIRRPLITIRDVLPDKLLYRDLTPSLPIAPAYDLPIETQYQFRPLRRGKYRWSKLIVTGSDSLGLVTKQLGVRTEPVELTVVPRPIPVSLDLPLAAGWGISEAESGQTRGAGIEPRGIREYNTGDSLRHVHWKSSARAGKLLVKEFEAGTHAAAAFLIQRTAGSDIVNKERSSLDLICGHLLYLAEVFLQQGAKVEFPGLSAHSAHGSVPDRLVEIGEALASIEDDQPAPVSSEVTRILPTLPLGSVLFVSLTVPDPHLAEAIAAGQTRGVTVVPLLYDARTIAPRAAASATDSGFVESLRRANTNPVLMPMEVASDR